MNGLLLLLLLLFWLLPTTSHSLTQTVCALRNLLLRVENYYRPGDLIIGGNLLLEKFWDFTLGFDFLKFTQEDRTVFPFFFRINPHEFLQYVGLVRLLLHFQWNWVGLVAPESDNGERFISTLMPMLKEKEICPAFTQLFKSESVAFAAMKLVPLILTWFKAEVVILFGESKSIKTIYVSLSLVEKLTRIAFRTVWILTSHWEISASHEALRFLKFFHGALHFRDHSHDIPEFRHLLLSLDPLRTQGDVFLPL
ncbi:hypothetical protein E2320_022270, partial [Naja naja]